MEIHENKILIDWLSFTSKVHDIDSIVEFLGLENVTFTKSRGFQGYADRLYFGGISIHYGHGVNQDIWVEMSGKGCRAFETFADVDFFFLFNKIVNEPEHYHITRLDVAYDCFDELIPIKRFAKDIAMKRFVTRFSEESCGFYVHAGLVGITVDMGSRSSDVRFRCYDKAYERGYRPGDDDWYSWVRFEIMLRNERAFSFLEQLTPENLGQLFRGVVTNYIRIVQPSSSDTNKSRWKITKWWSNFIDDAEAIQLFTPCETEYNMSKCERYVYRNCGNAIYTLLSVLGLPKFLRELKSNKPVMNQKYIKLLNDNDCKPFDYVALIDYLSKYKSENRDDSDGFYDSRIR